MVLHRVQPADETAGAIGDRDQRAARLIRNRREALREGIEVGVVGDARTGGGGVDRDAAVGAQNRPVVDDRCGRTQLDAALAGHLSVVDDVRQAGGAVEIQPRSAARAAEQVAVVGQVADIDTVNNDGRRYARATANGDAGVDHDVTAGGGDGRGGAGRDGLLGLRQSRTTQHHRSRDDAQTGRGGCRQPLHWPEAPAAFFEGDHGVCARG
ncbi:hypothetical protein FQZ97_1031710 [compost metagenome]